MSKSQKVWARWERKQKDGSVIKLRIEDFPIERQDEGFDFMKQYFIRDEAFHAAAEIHKNEESTEEYRQLLNIFYKENPPRSVYCRLDDDSSKPEIIGLSFMSLVNGSEDVKEIFKQIQSLLRTKELQTFFDLLVLIEEWCGPKDFEKFYDGRGIIVDPKYRGLGIANEFVKVRKLMCIEDDVPVTCAWMTAIGTQKAAEKNNWKILKEISTEELGKRSGLNFGDKLSTFKLMYTTKE